MAQMPVSRGARVTSSPRPAIRISRRREDGDSEVQRIGAGHEHSVLIDPCVLTSGSTLVVYWLGEEYAELLGEQAEGGAVPTWDYIRGQLDATWPMVSASYLPLLALVLARLAGAPALAAANVGLVTVLVLVMVHAWAAGRSARLRGWQLLFASSIAAGLGLAMIVLKDVVLTHVH
jgi:hypothetical protein